MTDNFTISSLGTDQQNLIFTAITIAESTDVTADEPGLTVLRPGATWGGDTTPPADQKSAVSPARVKVATSALRRPPSDLRRLDKDYRRLRVQLLGEYDVRTPGELDAVEALAWDMMRLARLQNALACLGRSLPDLRDVTPEGFEQLHKDYENAQRIRRALAVLQGSGEKPLSKACSRRVARLVQGSVRALADRGTWPKRDSWEQGRYAQKDGLWEELEPYRKELGNRDWVSAVLSRTLQPTADQKRALMIALQQRGELRKAWGTLKANEQRILEHSQKLLVEQMRNGEQSKYDRHLSAVTERIAKQRKQLEPCRRAVPGRGDRDR